MATIPGDEDLEGLEALLDPSTLEGRVARISLMTKGPGVMSLAMLSNGSNSMDLVVPKVSTPGSQYDGYARIDPTHFGSPPGSAKKADQFEMPSTEIKKSKPALETKVEPTKHVSEEEMDAERESSAPIRLEEIPAEEAEETGPLEALRGEDSFLEKTAA